MTKDNSILSPQELSDVKGGDNNTNGYWEWDYYTQKWVWIEKYTNN